MKGYALLNESASITAAQADTIAGAITAQLEQDLAPMWNTDPMRMDVFTYLDKVPPGLWRVLLSDDTDEPDDLAYHTDDNGNLYSKIQVKTILAYGGGILDAGSSGSCGVSIATSHEAIEQAVDPFCNLTVKPPWGGLVPLEPSDPVEGFYYERLGALVSDFVTPRWAQLGAKAPYDYMRKLAMPFAIGAGGYVVCQLADGTTSPRFGSEQPHPYILQRSLDRVAYHRQARR